MLTRSHYIECVRKLKLLVDDQWRDKALAWLTGQKVTNQGRVRTYNVAPHTADGLQFRSEPEIFVYRALKATGVSFAPLPIFVRGGQRYQRIEPGFVIFRDGIVLILEVDGDTYHRETPSEAYNRTALLENEGTRIIRKSATECDTQDKATTMVESVLKTMTKLKVASR
ncbi:MAG: hypothetical protein PHQ40_21495 [Anaerolineaceae bacterium]|nr:hypothetical protein [Anaerolineaceae bacterium]